MRTLVANLGRSLWARPVWVFVALFVIGYCGFLAYHWQGMRHPAAELVALVTPALKNAASRGDGNQISASSIAATPDSLREGNWISKETSSESSSENRLDSERVEAEQALSAKLDQVSSEIANVDPNVRAMAILRLGKVSPQFSIEHLQRVVVSDTALRNRQLAVQALKSVARLYGDKDGTIKAILRQSMADERLVNTAAAAIAQIESAPGGS